MLTSEELDALRAAIPADADLTRLLQTLRARSQPWLESPPVVPQVKALLSTDGGVCPDDGTTLQFDPRSPERHRCPRCGRVFSGDRHHRNWARAQHLWVAERIADFALLAGVAEADRAGASAGELLEIYGELYFRLPNRDNVLGPSHLFFSTYLESVWLNSYLAGAFLLRASGQLSEAQGAAVDRVAEAAAEVIGDFNEGLSNRQTWHAAALTAIAVWFDDLELARTAVEARTGLLGHLADGFGADGLWWEGENYHLFALRGLMQGMHWARVMGFDLLDDAELRRHFHAALLGPSRSALPDFTYPARRDSRYGVSLAQPASLELWEIGRAWLGGDAELDAWLGALYGDPHPLPPAEHYDAWLHDAGRPAPPRYSRSDLSWWALTAMAPAPAAVPEWQPQSALLTGQGLVVLRRAARYASLECGREIGGHGHPDRLHLTLHAGGVHWLPDQGTGSYVQPTLAWYRSAVAHNAPLVDGLNAGGEDAWCEAFAESDPWAWTRGRAGPLRRCLVAGPTHCLDVLELDGSEQHATVLPWHFQGGLELESPGHWEPAGFAHPFVSQVERLVPSAPGPIVVVLEHPGQGQSIRALFLAPDAELLRAVAPGLPVDPEPRPFLLLRGTGARIRWITVLDLAPVGSPDRVQGVESQGETVDIVTAAGATRFSFSPAGLRIVRGNQAITLAGLRPAPAQHQPIFAERTVNEVIARAPRITAAPALDGTLHGFDLSEPLHLDSEHQYRRSEEPYDPETFSARAWLNWDGESLYLAVAVSKPELCFRDQDAASLRFDNEPEDINSDGIQLYLRDTEGEVGWLLNPAGDGSLLARRIGTDGDTGDSLSGRWARSEEGYLITARLELPRLRHLGPGALLGFDLLVNEMQPGRVRRAGQLVWSGAGGWIYLRGDRHDPAPLGTLELS